MQVRHKTQFHEIVSLPSEIKKEPLARCPRCGGPAETDTYWSTSPERPGWRILKRQICCGQRPRRLRFQRQSTANCCPVVVEEIGLEAISKETEEYVPMNLVQPEQALDLIQEDEPHKSSRGRVPLEVRAQILELYAQDVPLPRIAQETSRSLSAVRNVVESSLPAGRLPIQETVRTSRVPLDEVVDFLSDLPDDTIAELVQLAQLCRQKRALRQSIEQRLRV